MNKSMRILRPLPFLAAVALLVIALGGVHPAQALADAGRQASPAAAPPFSGWLAMDRGDDYVQAAYDAELNLPGSVTIEGWIKNPSITTGIILKSGSFNLDITRTISGPEFEYHFCIIFFIRNVGVSHANACRTNDDGSTPSFLVGWHHFAYSYEETSNTGQVFWDGVEIGTGNNLGSGTADLILKYAQAMDEFRISDIARYTTDFVAPGAPFTCDEHTRALWHFDEISGSTVFSDACGATNNSFVGYNGAHSEGVIGYRVFMPQVSRPE